MLCKSLFVDNDNDGRESCLCRECCREAALDFLRRKGVARDGLTAMGVWFREADAAAIAEWIDGARAVEFCGMTSVLVPIELPLPAVDESQLRGGQRRPLAGAAVDESQRLEGPGVRPELGGGRVSAARGPASSTRPDPAPLEPRARPELAPIDAQPLMGVERAEAMGGPPVQAEEPGARWRAPGAARQAERRAVRRGPKMGWQSR